MTTAPTYKARRVTVGAIGRRRPMAPTVTRRALYVGAVVIAVMPLGIAAAASPRPIPSAYQRAAADAHIPASLLFAVALQESGTRLHGRLVPWPWTLDIGGQP